MSARREIAIRPGRQADTVSMLAITDDVWEGHDYVPFAWKHWLRELTGMVMVAEVDGTVVGLQHLAIQPDGTAWLEGIRVAPAARGRGVARAMMTNGIRWARSRGCPVVRLAVSDSNSASVRLSSGAGFRTTGQYCSFRAEGDDSPESRVRVRVAQPFDLAEIVAFLRVRNQAFYTEGWTAFRLTPRCVALLLARGAIMLVESERIDGAAIVTCRSGSPVPRLGLLEGTSRAMNILALAIRQFTRAGGFSQVLANVTDDPKVGRSLEHTGYAIHSNHKMLLRELLL